MGKPNFRTVGTLNAVETTPAIDVSHLEEWSAMASGTFVGTLSIEVSFDGGASFVPHPDMTAKTAPFVAVGGMRVQQIRGNMTAFTSGAAEILVSGTDTDVKD
jgi:hypothetical protein